MKLLSIYLQIACLFKLLCLDPKGALFQMCGSYTLFSIISKTDKNDLHVGHLYMVEKWDERLTKKAPCGMKCSVNNWRI